MQIDDSKARPNDTIADALLKKIWGLCQPFKNRLAVYPLIRQIFDGYVLIHIIMMLPNEDFWKDAFTPELVGRM